MGSLDAKRGWRVVFCQPAELAADSFVQSVRSKLAGQTGDLGAVLTVDSGFEKAPFESGTTDLLVSFGSPQLHSFDCLAEVARLMRPEGTVCLFERMAGRTFEDSSALNDRLTLCGFIDVKVGDAANTNMEWLLITARAPSWAQGEALALKPASVPVAQKNGGVGKGAAPAPAAANVWADVEDDGDTAMVDEDALLTETEKRSKPNVRPAGCDPAVSKRACKNCTCGRAEEEAETSSRKLTLAMLENPGVDSSCGSCALGDAFRCAGCPYRGLPAFQPGEKITLPDNFLSPDI